MPHIDARSGEVVIRIVYDGSPEAGKTTNVQQLSTLISLQRRGASKSPGTTGDRTEFFDWLDFSGGYLDGRRVRCQLVSVPGQSRLLHRRRYLLETADAIVFVADSRRDAFDDAAGNFTTTLRILERVARGVPVGVILQANKQDLPGALAPEEVLAALCTTRRVPTVGSVASQGEGVMQTFILAVRLATDRVRALLLDETLSDLPMASETPEGLHTAMVEIEANAGGAVGAAAAAEVPAPEPPPLPDIHANLVARLEEERLAAERLAAEHLAAEHADAVRRAVERVEAERAEAERIAAERAEADRIAAERIAAERAEAERIAAAREAAERAEAERIAAAREAAERAEAERIAAEHAEAERIAAEHAEAERIAAEHAEAERIAAARAEAERIAAAREAEAARAEAERIAAERVEAERIEAARKAGAARAEAERIAAERVEAERIEAARKAEAERIEAARKAEAERAEAERIAAERAEAERIAAERAEAERIAAERAEAERLAVERAEAERAAAERIAAERVEAERIEAARKAEAERVEAERIEAARKAEAERAAAERIAAERVEAERLAAERAAAEHAAAERDPARGSTLPHEPTQRRNRLVVGAAPAVPDATEIESGHVWPPVKGRGAIAFATDGPFKVPDVVRPWAPIGALELLSDSGWILHTSERWIFEREPDARRRLLTLVRGLLASATSIPDGRSLAISKDGAIWRLWLVTQRVPTVLDALLAALAEVNVARVISIVERTLWGIRERGTTAPVAAGLAGLTIHEGKFGVLALDEHDVESRVESRDPIGELFDLVDRHAHADPALSRWLDTDGIQLLSRARAQEVHP